MKKISILLITILTIGISIDSFAQQRGFVSVAWKTGITLSDSKNYADEFSLEGGQFGFERLISKNISLGMDIGYSHFYEEAGKISYESGNKTYTGSGFKYLDAVPIMLSGKYYLGLDRQNVRFVPYLGVSTGAYHITERLEIGSIAFEDNGWAFGVAPQLGFMIRLDKKAWFFSDFTYNSVFESGDIDQHSYLSGSFGVKIGF
jgi:outer membrane protein W